MTNGNPKSTAQIAGHPIHPMLVTIPIGLWVFSFVSDLVFVGGGRPIWHDLAFYTMAGGILGALAAAVPGMIDLFSMRDAQTKRIGFVHMAINLTVVLLFALNLGWRTNADPHASGPVWLSFVAILLLGISGWLGGEMVYVRGARCCRRSANAEGRPLDVGREATPV